MTPHCEEYLVFPENLTPHLAIDEVNFTQGELHTFVSSRDREGRAQKLVAMIRCTRSEDMINVLNPIAFSALSKYRKSQQVGLGL